MHVSFTRRTAALATTLTLALAAAGCGSSTLNTGSGGSGTPAPSATVAITEDATLAAAVPAALKAKGTLSVGTDASYPPNEFFASDGKTIQGMDVDMLNAIATTLGLKVKYTNADFGTIIGGVTSGKYDIAVSSFTINAKRMQQVTMVQYYSAGTSWAAPAGKTIDPANACGLRVAVQTSTVQVDDVAARSKKCVADGKKAITVISEVAQTKVAADVANDKADAMAADSPVTAYAIKTMNGQLVAVGTTYDTAPYGIVVAKNQADFAKSISDALAKLQQTGAYKQVLEKWGVQDGAVTSFPVNPAQ